MNSSADRVRIIDFETTGTQDDDQSQVIEEGSYDLVLETGIIGFPYSSLYGASKPIPPEVKAVHHITDEDIAGSPLFVDCLEDFCKGMGEADIFAAHNIKFERHFFPGERHRWICTYKCALTVWPEAPGHSNQVLRYWLNIDEDDDFAGWRAMPPHRALPDAYVTAFILRRLLSERTVNELVEISSKPALFHKLTFGKHRGLAYADAPSDYLHWIVHRSDLDEDTKHSARYWLEGGNKTT